MKTKSQVIAEVSLAGSWDFLPEGSQWTTIEVPGGGWLKQGFDCEAGTYQRRIAIPPTEAPCAVRLELGAVNHLAQVWIGESESSLRLVHEEVTAFTPQTVSLTPYVLPGKSYLLRIFVRAYQNGRPIAPHWAEWCECISRGLFRSAFLRLYPTTFIADAHVKTSVSSRTLTYDIWVANASEKDQSVTLGGVLSSWNGSDWSYPSIPEQTVTLKAGETVKTTVGPLEWNPGPQSYWQPNLPYRPDYHAQLHTLNLTLRKAGENSSSYTIPVRFGFREMRQAGPYYELNGVRINFRGDNLQVANYDRIDHNGKGDAIDTLPGFLPPSTICPGWPQAVDHFLRLNYTIQREHMGPWTPYMIDVCDEMGLMLIGESATRWNGFDMENDRGFHEVKCLEDIVRRDRNHPSIIRWSTKNEAQCLDPQYHVELYEAVKALDDTRPISEDIVWTDATVFDVNKVFAGLAGKPDFTWIDHYLSYDAAGKPYFSTIQPSDAVVPLANRPFGMGEGDWMRSSTPAGLPWFAATTVLARVQGASDVRPYVLLSSWASSIPGVKTTDFLTEENRHPVYGEDNLPDPWVHPGIHLLQTACSPFLAVDAEFWRLNKSSDAFGHFPVQFPVLQAMSSASRIITVFNDDMAGDELELVWELREGSLSNWVYAQGKVPLVIMPGYSQTIDLEFRTPRFNTFIFLTLKVTKNGRKVFTDPSTCYEVAGGEDFRSDFNGEERLFK